MGKDTDFNPEEFDKPDYQAETPTYDCMGQVVCKLCGKFHGYCSEVKAFNTYQPQQGGRNVNISEHLGGEQSERNPFIQAEQVAKSGSKFTIIRVREVKTPARKAEKGKKASQGFVGLMVDIKNGTKKYCLPLRYDRKIDLENAVKQLKSEDTDDWMGKKIKLIKVKGKNGGTFVNVAR